MIMIIDLLLVIFLILILNFSHYFYKSSNLTQYNNVDPRYGRFSKVDSYNYLIFPKLIFTHPINFVLKPGESMYIPKGWWHWVKNTQKTFAVNYNFDNVIRVDKPFIFKTSRKTKFNIEVLNDVKIGVWNSQTSEITESVFKEFYNSGKDGTNIVTLESSVIGKKNKTLKDEIKSIMKLPKHKLVKSKVFGYNIWASSGKHDSGLHYDRYDGILSVIEGEKTITMFPPSDSDYLYPFIV